MRNSSRYHFYLYKYLFTKFFVKIIFLVVLDFITVISKNKLNFLKLKNKVVRNLLIRYNGFSFKILDFRSLIISLPFYEREFIKILKKEKYDVLIDVGAHIGKFAIEFRNNAKEIIAIEPNPITLQYLKENLELNKVKHYILYDYVISSKNKTISFILNKVRSDVSKVLDNDSILKDYIIIKKEAKKLDDLVKVQNKKILLKIDVEGHEYHVLKGAQKLLKNNKVVIFIEISKKTEIVYKALKQLRFHKVFSKKYITFDKKIISKEIWKNY